MAAAPRPRDISGRSGAEPEMQEKMQTRCAASRWLTTARRHIKRMLRARPSFEDLYEVKSVLGEGAFSAVVLAASRDRPDELCAVKIYNTEGMRHYEKELLAREAETMRALSHPHIVRLRDALSTRRRFYLVMEYLSGGELLERLKRRRVLREDEAAAVMRGVFEGVLYLHSHGIVHRDLKLENLVYESDAPGAPVKITDFGFAKALDESGKLETPCGSAAYVAPEIVREEPYDMSVDMWSLGVILYTLLCGYPPFFDEDEQHLFELISRGAFDWPDPRVVPISDAARDLVSKLLRVSPSERLTAEVALEHRWFREVFPQEDSPRAGSAASAVPQQPIDLGKPSAACVRAKREAGAVKLAPAECAIAKRRAEKRKKKEVASAAASATEATAAHPEGPELLDVPRYSVV